MRFPAGCQRLRHILRTGHRFVIYEADKHGDLVEEEQSIRHTMDPLEKAEYLSQGLKKFPVYPLQIGNMAGHQIVRMIHYAGHSVFHDKGAQALQFRNVLFVCVTTECPQNPDSVVLSV